VDDNTRTLGLSEAQTRRLGCFVVAAQLTEDVDDHSHGRVTGYGKKETLADARPKPIRVRLDMLDTAAGLPRPISY